MDRLADLKRALAQLNDAGTADRHLIGLETVANAARALFDDDKQTRALRLFADPSVDADMEPMLETGNGGYAYMDELAKYRIYGLHTSSAFGVIKSFQTYRVTDMTHSSARANGDEQTRVSTRAISTSTPRG